jgi:hypothetical protein
MSDTEFVPCPEWAEKLADLHSHNLSPSNQATLEAHLASCQACAAVLLEYQRMDERIHQALNVKQLPSFTPELLRAQEATPQKRRLHPRIFQANTSVTFTSTIAFTIAPGSLQQQPTLRSRKRSVSLTIFLTLLFTLTIGTGLLLFVPRHSSSSSTTRSVTPTLTPPTPGVHVYPVIAASYAGTIVDLLSNQKTALYLTHIQQHGGSLSGNFKGLDLNGPFKGSVTPTGDIVFTVTVNRAGAPTFKFTGNIKIGGDMTGTFKAPNQQGQPIGEYGVWDVSSTS